MRGDGTWCTVLCQGCGHFHGKTEGPGVAQWSRWGTTEGGLLGALSWVLVSSAGGNESEGVRLWRFEERRVSSGGWDSD